MIPAGLEPISRHPTGSRYICNPPVMTTDVDVVLLVQSLDTAARVLRGDGWIVNADNCDEYSYQSNFEIPFMTARKGEHNLIVYDTTEGYNAFVRATEVARHFNLRDKQDRIMLFAAVCGGRSLH